MLAPLVNTVIPFFDAYFFIIWSFSRDNSAEILALLFLLVYIVLLAFCSCLVIMLVQLTRNQVAQYAINPNDEQHLILICHLHCLDLSL